MRTFSNTVASACSSKAGQIALMKMAAYELARDHVRVNAIRPGAIHTNINERTQKRHTKSVEVKVDFPDGRPSVNGGVGGIFEVAGSSCPTKADM